MDKHYVLYFVNCTTCIIYLGNDALSYGTDSGFHHLKDVFSRAPTQAQWSVNQQDQGTSNQAEKTKSG